MKSVSDLIWKDFRKDGDRDCFKSLFDLLYTPLCRYSFFFTGDMLDSEEVVMDFFLYLWLHRSDITLEKSFEAYAKRSVHNRSLNKIRDRKNGEQLTEDEAFRIEPEYGMDTQTIMDVAWEAVSSLSPKCQEVYLLSRKDGLSDVQIAQKLGLAVKTVEGYKTKAFKFLRSKISNDIK